MSEETLWIFGYGSLVWRPAFPHLRAFPARISGFTRRFWQGSTDHRGVPGAPGRVVTLVAEDTHAPGDDSVNSIGRELCWGIAYEVPRSDPEGVLKGLDDRERGGYERLSIQLSIQLAADVTPNATASPLRSSTFSPMPTPTPMPTPRHADRELELRRTVHSIETQGVVYIAGPENENYLGPAPIDEIAAQVASAAGPSGPNREYVFELAESLRRMGAVDLHVFELAAALRALIETNRT